jgi:hypothetical protein
MPLLPRCLALFEDHARSARMVSFSARRRMSRCGPIDLPGEGVLPTSPQPSTTTINKQRLQREDKSSNQKIQGLCDTHPQAVAVRRDISCAGQASHKP